MLNNKKLLIIKGEIDLLTGKIFEESEYGGYIKTNLYDIEKIEKTKNAINVGYYVYNIFYFFDNTEPEREYKEINIKYTNIYKISKEINDVVFDNKNVFEQIDKGIWVHFEKAILVDEYNYDIEVEKQKAVEYILKNNKIRRVK